MLATYDSSIAPYGGVEFKTLVYDSLNGVKQSFRTVEENMVFCPEYDEHFGTHVHIGHGKRFTMLFYHWINFLSCELFDELGEYLFENSDLCKMVFGRPFIEYRILQFRNAKQYFWGVCLCKEMTKVLLEGFEKNIEPSKVSKKLVKLFIKHCNGEMNYQRPERNSK